MNEEQNDITGLPQHVLNGALCYLGVLVLLPLFSGATSNPFVKFHAKQGLVLLSIEVIAVIASSWSSFIGGIVFVVMLLLSLAGLFSALREKKWIIPGVGYLASLFTI